jgi:hypothetical protein
MQIDGWNLSGTRPQACTTGVLCGAPIVIGSSVQAGIKIPPTGTLAVRPWCTGKLPNFTYIPCVFKYNWLNKSTGQGNNDIQVQTYTPQLDMIKTGGSG